MVNPIQGARNFADELPEVVPTGGLPGGQQIDELATPEGGGVLDDAARSVDRGELVLDLAQIGLDIAGIADPTPISDGVNGIISLFRGDWLGAGISVVSMVPYLGDAAKAGKMGKWAETVANAADLARRDPGFAEMARPALGAIRDALDAIPDAVMRRLPEGAQDNLRRMSTKIDEALEAGRRLTTRVGDNDLAWTLDAQGRPVEATATLREVFSSAPRSADELAAQRNLPGKLPDDHAGHVIGHRFGLDNGDINMFPQNANFNTSAYKRLENEMADWVEAGGEVNVTQRLTWPDGADRPSRVRVDYTVTNPDTGEVIFENRARFRNEAGQTFDRVPRGDMADLLGGE